jgi:hypothetical protein
MRADICETGDARALEKFKETLRLMGAKKEDENWAIGVSTTTIKIGDQQLTVFSDAYSMDIEGPERLVKAVVAEFQHLLSKV